MLALALVDAFVPKLKASQQLLPVVAKRCDRSEMVKGSQKSV
jgi:hypothetical protein